jgi:serine/threonine protein phosphatase 1
VATSQDEHNIDIIRLPSLRLLYVLARMDASTFHRQANAHGNCDIMSGRLSIDWLAWRAATNGTSRQRMMESGHRTYLISDVHGCYDQFVALLDRVSFGSRDTLYLMGDMIDRGPKSDAMVNWLVHEAGSNVHLMLGNHEYMMLEDSPSPTHFRPRFDGDWGYNGNGGTDTGEQVSDGCSPDTIARYLGMCRNASRHEIVTYRNEITGKDAKVLLVHAGIMPPRSQEDGKTLEGLLSRQSTFNEVWIREPWLFSAWRPPIDVIFGHTPTHLVATLATKLHDDDRLSGLVFGQDAQDAMRHGMPGQRQIERGLDRKIMRWNGKTDIDCGCVYGGRLACVRLEDGSIWYEDGEVD